MKTIRLQLEQIEEVAAIIKAGGMVAIPTDTVYGLAIDSSNLPAIDSSVTISAVGEGTSFSAPKIMSLPELMMSCAPAKKSMQASRVVAMVSALPCPQGWHSSAGREMIRATIRLIIAMNTSTDESMPSPITARLPE